MVLLQLSCHVAGYGTTCPASPLPASPLPARAGAGAGRWPCERGVSLLGGQTLCALMLCHGEVVLVCWRGSAKSLASAETLRDSFGGRKTKEFPFQKTISLKDAARANFLHLLITLFPPQRHSYPCFRNSFPFMLHFSGRRTRAELLSLPLTHFCRVSAVTLTLFAAPSCCSDKSVPSASSSKREAGVISANHICSSRD